jgi:uncharacterized protein (DUF2252 family)
MSDIVQQQPLTTRAERKAAGKAMRQQVPLASHSQWHAAPDRPEPLEVLQAQDQGRLKHLLPIKYGRMLESPFTFYRGSAVLMAMDLAKSPITGIKAVLCGDAHLSNFGLFASPERRVVFDINDFDEAFVGPWEWDVKRLAASAVIAGRDNGFGEKTCRELVVDTVRAYIKAMDHFSQMRTLDQWYFHIEVNSLLTAFEQASKKGQKSAAKMVKKARRRTHEQTLEKLTYVEDSRRRIISDPPLLVPLREFDLAQYLSSADLEKISLAGVEESWNQYLTSLPDERRYLLRRYQITDVALRVGGIGSVGTRCFIVLLKGGAEDDGLILQLKEAGPSVLEPYVSFQSATESHARRVVTAQRLMQATSDIFLGWNVGALSGLDYYWRQFKDMKGSADIASLDESGLEVYLVLCGWCLARAHARTGDEIQIRGYLGRKDTFAEAVAEFAVAYADQAEQDYETLVKAVKTGRIVAETGI